MKKYGEELKVSEERVPLLTFLKSYSENLPASFPRPSLAQLKEFKASHPLFFKHGSLWSLDEHRKKVMDWLPQHPALGSGSDKR